MTLRPKDSVDELIGVLILRRRMLKKSKAWVARRCHTNRDVISLMENGEFDPPLRLLLAYAGAVGMDLEWKLGASTSPGPAVIGTGWKDNFEDRS